jgi:hypothetical protein
MGRVLHASYSGYFPFCLSDGPESPFLFNTATIDSAMNLWWRVKKIRFYGVFGLPDFAPTTYHDWGLVVERNAVSEESLVCEPSPSWNVISVLNLEPSVAGLYYTNVYTNNENYVPVVGVFGGFLAEGIPQEFGFEYLSVYDPITLRGKSISIDGVTLSEVGIALYSDSGTLNYEILEYWSYDGIYDTTTGLPL